MKSRAYFSELIDGQTWTSVLHSRRITEYKEEFVRIALPWGHLSWDTSFLSQTLGTALGDWTADTAGFGYAGVAIGARKGLKTFVFELFKAVLCRGIHGFHSRFQSVVHRLLPQRATPCRKRMSRN